MLFSHSGAVTIASRGAGACGFGIGCTLLLTKLCTPVLKPHLREGQTEG